jgi:hypothetical protein
MPDSPRKPRRVVRKLTPEVAEGRLREARRTYEIARRELEDAIETRDKAIALASRTGISRRDVARMAGVSPGRVQQVLDRRRLKKVRTTKAPATER